MLIGCLLDRNGGSRRCRHRHRRPSKALHVVKAKKINILSHTGTIMQTTVTATESGATDKMRTDSNVAKAGRKKIHYKLKQ